VAASKFDSCAAADSIDGLLLDPDHPRASLPDASKVWLQSMHTECLAQLAAHNQGRQALLADPSVCEALEAVAHGVLSETSRQMAVSSLVALSDHQPEPKARSDDGSDDGQHKHVMLSYNWNDQPTIIRLNLSLQRRGYLTWIVRVGSLACVPAAAAAPKADTERVCVCRTLRRCRGAWLMRKYSTQSICLCL
jgi:hypothetical protein